MTDRTITDIILSLEEKVDNLSKRAVNNEALLKNILNSINRLARAGVSAPVPTATPSAPVATAAPVQEAAPVEPKSHFQKLKEMHGITDETTDVEQLKNGFRKIDRAAVGASNINVKKTSVTQQLTHEGTPLIVAAVEIKNLNGKIVESCRTNQKGTWVASLEPGTYIVFVIKRFAKESRQPIEANYEINVSSMQETLILNPKDV